MEEPAHRFRLAWAALETKDRECPHRQVIMLCSRPLTLNNKEFRLDIAMLGNAFSEYRMDTVTQSMATLRVDISSS